MQFLADVTNKEMSELEKYAVSSVQHDVRNTTVLKRILNGFRRMLKVQNHVKEEKVDNY